MLYVKLVKRLWARQQLHERWGNGRNGLWKCRQSTINCYTLSPRKRFLWIDTYHLEWDHTQLANCSWYSYRWEHSLHPWIFKVKIARQLNYLRINQHKHERITSAYFSTSPCWIHWTKSWTNNERRNNPFKEWTQIVTYTIQLLT